MPTKLGRIKPIETTSRNHGLVETYVDGGLSDEFGAIVSCRPDTAIGRPLPAIAPRQAPMLVLASGRERITRCMLADLADEAALALTPASRPSAQLGGGLQEAQRPASTIPNADLEDEFRIS